MAKNKSKDSYEEATKKAGRPLGEGYGKSGFAPMTKKEYNAIMKIRPYPHMHMHGQKKSQ